MKKVEIFALNNALQQGGCGCSCDCSTDGNSEAKMTIEAQIASFTKEHPLVANIELKLWDEADNSSFLNKVNTLLKANGEKLEVAVNNQNFVLPKILPMMVVNGKILSINALPSEAEFSKVIINEQNLDKSAGCC